MGLIYTNTLAKALMASPLFNPRLIFIEETSNDRSMINGRMSAGFATTSLAFFNWRNRKDVLIIED